MKKKLLAAAVAGALVAPGMAMAQSSTVQIYGVLNAEYGFYSAPDAPGPVGRNSTDQFNAGASRIGFKGEEKLGGGLSAWFQCETQLRFLEGGTQSAGNWCDRNSALGLKGGWGNVYFGTWDTPAKQVTSATRMLNETGIFGAQHLLMTFAGFGYSGRVVNGVNYASPNMNGFVINGQYSAENSARNSLDNAAGAVTEARHMGLNGIYRSGPLVVGLGYHKRENLLAFATATPAPGPDGLDDTVFNFGINYTFGAFKAGFVWTSIEADRVVGAPALERDAFNFALDWKLGGPGMVRFGITHAGSTDGVANCTTCGSATQYQVTYNHSFSKRTVGTIGFVLLDNGGGGVYNLQAQAGGAANVQPGEKTNAIGLGLLHTF